MTTPKSVEEIVEHVASVCDDVEFLRGVPVKLPSDTKAMLRGRIREALTTCGTARFEEGVKAERERVREWAERQRMILRDERTTYDIPATEEYKRGFATALNGIEWDLSNK